jgi:serine/threonine-protein kinase
VAIVVARSKQKLAVPSVIGKERRQAVEMIRRAGFVPFVEEAETPEQGRIGRVLEQSPEAGSRQVEGSEVDIVVGKRTAAVPEEESEAEEGPLP